MVRLKLVISKEKREWQPVSEDYEPTSEELSIWREDIKFKYSRDSTDEELKTWFIISLSDRIKQKYDNMQILQSRGLDCPIVVVGPTGAGKSTFMKLGAWYCSKGTTNIDNFIAGTEIFGKLDSAPDGSDVLIDEAVLNLSASDAMKDFSKQMVKIFSTIRQKRLRIWMVIPDFFALHKYIAVFRSLFVVRCYFTTDFKQGRFAYWGQRRKAQLYELGKKNYGSFAKPKANFISTFSNFIPPYEAEYQKLKRQSLRMAFEGDKKPEKFELKAYDKNIRISLFKSCYAEKVASIANLARGFGITKQTGIAWLKKEIKPISLLSNGLSKKRQDSSYNLNGSEEISAEEGEEEDFEVNESEEPTQ